MLVDTDVLIWFLRGNDTAKKAIKNIPQPAISAVTHMEILTGLHNKTELKSWKSFLKDYNFHHIPIDAEITTKAVYWVEEFCLSHKLRMADALIAATADAHGLDLLTGNLSDYKFLPGLTVKIFKAH